MSATDSLSPNSASGAGVEVSSNASGFSVILTRIFSLSVNSLCGAIWQQTSYDAVRAPWRVPEISKEAHPDVILFVFGKRLIVSPAFHFQIGDDVLPGCCRCLVSPSPANLFNSCS